MSDIHKFNEERYLEELATYIKSTYGEHYSGKGGVQSFELIAACDNGKGFAIGSIIKYASRYGKKNGYNRKDLLKILHYGLLALHVHDSQESITKE